MNTLYIGPWIRTIPFRQDMTTAHRAFSPIACPLFVHRGASFSTDIVPARQGSMGTIPFSLAALGHRPPEGHGFAYPWGDDGMAAQAPPLHRP